MTHAQLYLKVLPVLHIASQSQLDFLSNVFDLSCFIV